MPTPWMVWGPLKNSISRLRAEIHLVVELAHEGVFEGDPLVDAHWVVMAALDHKGPGRHQIGQVGVVENIGEVEFVHVVFLGQHVALRRKDIGRLPDPLVEVAGADRESILIEQGRHADGCFAAVRQAVKADPPGIDKRKAGKPIQGLLMLAQE